MNEREIEECHTVPRTDSGVGRCEVHLRSIWECRFRASEQREAGLTDLMARELSALSSANHDLHGKIAALKAELAEAKKKLESTLALPKTVEVSFASCGHNKYWTGHFGTCMACRAEKAEAEVERIRREVVAPLKRLHDETMARQNREILAAESERDSLLRVVERKDEALESARHEVAKNTGLEAGIALRKITAALALTKDTPPTERKEEGCVCGCAASEHFADDHSGYDYCHACKDCTSLKVNGLCGLCGQLRIYHQKFRMCGE